MILALCFWQGAFLRLVSLGLQFEKKVQKGEGRMPNTYGYIRVSSREQNEDRQVIALGEVGVTGKAIYMDKQSG